jgi:glycosyltransferase 2 family protein
LIAPAAPTGGPPRARFRLFGTILRLAFAVALTAWLLWKVDPRALLDVLARTSWAPVGIAALLVVADRTLMAYRWVALLRTLEPHQRPRTGALMRVFFVSTFVGTFLPGSIGGDAVRSYSTHKLKVPVADAVASVFMDRMLGVASILLMAVAGLVIARDLATDAAVVTGLLASATLCAATIAMVFSRRAAAWAGALAAQAPVEVIRRVAAQVIDAVAKYAGHPRPLLVVLLCSVLVQILRVLQAYLLGQGLAIAAPLSAYFAFIPLILLVMLLPITFNGLGTGQAAFVWAFSRAGVPDASSLALSFLFIALGILGNLPGALLYVVGTKHLHDHG